MTYNEEFKRIAQEIEDNGTMNVYVQEAIERNAPIVELTKEIKLAIKMHRKYASQVGSSPLHFAVVCAMTRLLAALTKQNN